MKWENDCLIMMTILLKYYYQIKKKMTYIKRHLLLINIYKISTEKF